MKKRLSLTTIKKLKRCLMYFINCTFEIIYHIDSACRWNILYIYQYVPFHISSRTIWVVTSAAPLGKNRIDNTTNRSKYIFLPDISNAPFNHFMINLTNLSDTISPAYSLIEGTRQNLIYSAPWPWPGLHRKSFQIRRLKSSEKYFNQIFSSEYWQYAKPWLRKGSAAGRYKLQGWLATQFLLSMWTAQPPTWRWRGNVR